MRDWLYPGAKVVCVDDSWSLQPAPIERGRIYVVASICEGEGYRSGQGWKRGIEIKLIGVRRPFGDKGFDADRFRPLRKRTTDISIFRQLLTPSKQKEGVT